MWSVDLRAGHWEPQMADRLVNSMAASKAANWVEETAATTAVMTAVSSANPMAGCSVGLRETPTVVPTESYSAVPSAALKDGN